MRPQKCENEPNLGKRFGSFETGHYRVLKIVFFGKYEAYIPLNKSRSPIFCVYSKISS